MQPLVIIGGATGVGKTALSIKLAKNIGGEIISADSMQVYKEFNIGTAKITKEEMEGIPHHLIDILDADEEFNVFEFKIRALEAILEIYCNGHIPIIVGGTGFYIQSVLYDINFDEENDNKEYRRHLEEMAAHEGPEMLHNLLAMVDPDSALEIHPNNAKRVIRALEYNYMTGKKMSEHNQEQKNKKSPYNFAYFVLNRSRDDIYDRIEKRIDKMMENGLEQEIRRLLDKGISSDCLAMQGLGYKEMIPYINGESSLDDAVNKLKLNTRHFAKRQNTWFKREKDAIWFDYEDFPDNDAMIKKMIDILKEKEIV